MPVNINHVANSIFASGGDESVLFKDTANVVNALGNCSGAKTIDLKLGNVVTAITIGNTTWTFSNLSSSGKLSWFKLILTNGGTAIQIWPDSVRWDDGSIPILSRDSDDVLMFSTVNNGTTWRCSVEGLNMKGISRGMFAWGYNNNGELGDGTVVSKSSPVQIGSLTLWTKITSGVRSLGIIPAA